MAIYLGKEAVGGLNGRLNMYLGKQKVINPTLGNWRWVRRPSLPSFPASRPRGIAVSADGNTVAVTISSFPWFVVYDWVESTWKKRADPTDVPYGASGLRNNADIRISDDGNTIAFAHYVVGDHISVFDWDRTSWTRRPSFDLPYTNSGSFGLTQYIGLSGDGLIVAAISQEVGTDNVWRVYPKIFEYHNGGWTDVSDGLYSADRDGSVTISGTGNIVAHIFASSSYGYLLLGVRRGGGWLRLFVNAPATIGFSALSNDGSIVCAGNNLWYEKSNYTFRPSNIPAPPNLTIGIRGLSGSGKTVLGSVAGLTRTLGVSDFFNGAWIPRSNVGTYPDTPNGVINAYFGHDISRVGNTVATCFPASPYVYVWDWLPEIL